jgi:hypothetical protein
MVLGAIFISRDKIFCFRTGFLRILSLTALTTFFVRTRRGRPDLFLSQTEEVSLYLKVTVYRL